MNFKIKIFLIFFTCFTISIHSENYNFIPIPDQEKEDPIDKQYNTEINNWKNLYEWDSLILKYSNLWSNEMNNVYNQVLQKLNTDQRNVLIDSQNKWKEHIETEKKLLRSVLYKSNSDNLIGREGYYHAATYFMFEIRERVFYLRTYLYFLNN